MAKKGFWDRFSDMMDSLPEYIDGEINSVGDNSISTVGSNNVVSISGNSSIKQTSRLGKSSSVIKQGGHKIVITTKGKETTIEVDGKEYVPKA